MKSLHILFILSSFNVLLVTLERFSFTTEVMLQPYNFLRLHEVIQMTFIILSTALLSFFMLRTVTHSFQNVRSIRETLYLLLFFIGLYFYATGNGAHEIASYILNTYCDTKTIPVSGMCASAFFNDYYFGNILYFCGAFFMYLSIMLFERNRPDFKMQKNDIAMISTNAIILALAIFAYAAFDPVLVGVIYSVIMMVTSWIFLWTSTVSFRRQPVAFYNTVAYSIGTILSLVFRFA